VVLASEGYPGAYPRGREIHGLDSIGDRAIVFHAGTTLHDGKAVTAGGRVLGATGWGATLPEALATAYAALGRISFEGMQYRRDIGRMPHDDLFLDRREH
jgi:phosphoribosylamine--glycine ligase